MNFDFEKTCDFSGRDQRGNPYCVPFGYIAQDGLVKTAQLELTENLHPRIQDFVRAVRPTAHGVYVLVNAMGAGEYWGSNANGDHFPEKALIHAPAGWNEFSPEQMKQVGSTWEYGFPTFMNAHVFTHHQNKDPAKSIGDVVLAVWNPKMHRVELILYIDRTKCMAQAALHVIERIEQGEFPDCSMGCKVPFDVCMICGNKSKTRADYCQCCIRKMNKILPDGRKVCVRNDFPRFFDLSIVFVGADKTAKVMAKLAEHEDRVCLGGFCTIKTARQVLPGWPKLAAYVAEVAGIEKVACDTRCPCDRLGTSTCCIAGQQKFAMRLFGVDPEKLASQRKLSEIIKDIPAGPFSRETLPQLEKNEPDIPNHLLDEMAADPSRSLSTAGMMGVVLKPHEFQRLILVCAGRRPLAQELAETNSVFGQTAGLEDSIPIGPDLIDHRLQGLLTIMGLMRARSIATPLLQQRAQGGQPCPQPTPMNGHPVLEKVAELYNGYRRALLKKAAAVSENLVSDPQLHAVIYGDSMAKAFASGTEKIAAASVLGPESLAYLMGAFYPQRDLHATDDVAGSLAQMGSLAEASA